MRLTREEYEAAIAELATRVELNAIKIDTEELRKKVEEISKRSLQDGDLFSKMLVSHDDRLRMLENRAARQS